MPEIENPFKLANSIFKGKTIFNLDKIKSFG